MCLKMAFHDQTPSEIVDKQWPQPGPCLDKGISAEWDEQSRSLPQAALFDPLTGLPDRHFLLEKLQQSIAQTARDGHLLAVCHLDLDGFQRINDIHGRSIGDQLLISVSRRLREGVRAFDTLSRGVGDEFTLILSGMRQRQEIDDVLTHISTLVEQPHHLMSMDICILASIGATVYPDDCSDAETLLRHAGKAMNIAKQDGCGQYRFYSQHQYDDQEASLLSINRMRQAIDENELCLYYQPKIDLRDGRLIGFEALLRWQHPERGLLLPGAFLPGVEKSTFMCEIDAWVVDAVLRQLPTWAESLPDVRISINLSACSLEEPCFADRLFDRLDVLPGELATQLDFEILESSIINDLDSVIALIDRCHARGITFSLDDFGTAYSSLSHLKQLKVNTVKIDRLFIHDLENSPGDLAMVRAVVGLAAAYKLDVVAEGVETPEQRRILVENACCYGQGFGISEPLPVAQIANWQRSFSTRQVCGIKPRDVCAGGEHAR